MDVSNNRREYSKKLGDQAEDKFIELIRIYLKENKYPINIKKSNSYQDRRLHIDYYINNKGFDIKAKRHLETIWLEKKNVNGYDGWLLGEAHYIVFDILELNTFCIFKREDLYNHIKDVNEHTINKYEYNKIYTRSKWGKKDELIKVKYNDIKHLEVFKLHYDNQTKLDL